MQVCHQFRGRGVLHRHILHLFVLVDGQVIVVVCDFLFRHKKALLCALADALGVLPSALDSPHIKSREVLNQLLLALEDEYGLTVTITENNERSICNGK